MSYQLAELKRATDRETQRFGQIYSCVKTAHVALIEEVKQLQQKENWAAELFDKDAQDISKTIFLVDIDNQAEYGLAVPPIHIYKRISRWDKEA